MGVWGLFKIRQSVARVPRRIETGEAGSMKRAHCNRLLPVEPSPGVDCPDRLAEDFPLVP